jgi:dihydrofolate synthase/folylpolyglutamate synthase
MRFNRLSDWLSWQETLHPNAIDLGLDRLRRTLHALGWRRPSCPVITIAGTNGKGSSVALLTRILSEAGYRVGTFTSPHLLDYNERITLAERPVSDASLIAAFERIDAARGSDTLTFFEFNTLAALLIFETACLDAIVLEVGMGGRLDAVNVVDADAALVTSIALDHCEWLGDNLEAIGREKAGIFRPSRPAVLGSRNLPKSIFEAADALGSRVLWIGREFDYVRQGARWSWCGQQQHWGDLPAPSLVGDIQYDNAAAVLAVLESLSDRLPVDRGAIERGLTSTQLIGRFQVVPERGFEWILDVAHNPAAAHTLAAQLDGRPVRGKTIAVCGMLGDKDIEGVAAELSGRFDAWIVAGLMGARAIAPEQVAERLRGGGASVSELAPDIVEACRRAERLAAAGDRIVVFGSFLAVAPVLEWLRSRGLG